MCVGHAATHWVSAIFYMLLPFIREEMGMSYAEAGLLASAYQTGFFLGSLASGPVVDITGRRVVFQVGALVAIGAAITVIGVAENFLLYLVMVMLMGGAANFWHPPAIAFISDTYPNNRGLALGVHGMGSNMGEAYGPLVAGYLITLISWQGTAVAAGMPTVAVAFLLFIILIGKDKQVSGKGTQSQGQSLSEYVANFADLLRNPIVVGISCMSGIRSAGQTLVKTFLPLFMKDSLGMGAAMMGWALFVMQHGGMIVAPIAGVAADRYGRRRMLILVLSVTSASMVGLTFIEDKMLFVVGMGAFGFVTYAMRPISQAWMMDAVSNDMAASSMSLMFLVQGVLGMLSPFLGGWLADTYGLESVFYLIAGLLLIANAVTFFIPDPSKNVAQPVAKPAE
jgi:MFS family permease